MTETMEMQTAQTPRKRRWKRHPVIRALTGLLLVFIPVPLSSFLLARFVDHSARIVWPPLLIGTICFLMYRLFVHRIEKREMTEFGRDGAVRELGGGLLLGFVMATFVFAVLAATGVYQVEAFDGMSVEIVRRTATTLLVGFFEEMLMRGILFGIIEESLGSAAGVAGSAVLFGLAHLPGQGATAIGIVNSMAAGVTLAAAYMLTRRLWLPIGIHIAWNFTIAQLFSAVVSGHGTEPGLLRGRLAGPAWLTGGAFGVEASVVALFGDVVVSSVLLCIIAKRRAHRPSVVLAVPIDAT